MEGEWNNPTLKKTNRFGNTEGQLVTASWFRTYKTKIGPTEPSQKTKQLHVQ